MWLLLCLAAESFSRVLYHFGFDSRAFCRLPFLLGHQLVIEVLVSRVFKFAFARLTCFALVQTTVTGFLRTHLRLEVVLLHGRR